MQIISKITLVVFLFSTQISFAQSWFSESSNWYNNYTNFSIEGYVQLSFGGDTIIQDLACKKFNFDQAVYSYTLYTNFYSSGSPLYFVENNDVVQLFMDEQFDTIINMNTQIDDFWTFDFESDVDYFDHVDVRVDVQDKDNIMLEGVSLKRLMVLYTYIYYPFGQGELTTMTRADTLIDRVGNTNMFIDPRQSLYETLDAHNAQSLRCYSDLDIGTYQHDFRTDCDFVVPTFDIQAETDLRVFPNPTIDRFTIDSSKPVQRVDCYNINGQLVRSMIPEGADFDLSGLPAGLYRLRMQLEDSNAFQTIVKQ